MARYDFRSPRLFIDAPLAAGVTIALTREHMNYLLNVLRMKPDDSVLVFNGRDGEWRTRLQVVGKKQAALVATEQTRPQTPPTDVHFCFAPLKHARLDYMTQKAVELGASRLQPVMTRHTQSDRVNLDRMRANAIEAAEQCGVLSLADIAEPVTLDRYIAAREAERLLVFCDEDADVSDPVAALGAVSSSECVRAIAVLIGPEGGFSAEERTAMLRLPNIVRLSLGPRILRADTAAMAALTLVQAVLGDWH